MSGWQVEWELSSGWQVADVFGGVCVGHGGTKSSCSRERCPHPLEAHFGVCWWWHCRFMDGT